VATSGPFAPAVNEYGARSKLGEENGSIVGRFERALEV